MVQAEWFTWALLAWAVSLFQLCLDCSKSLSIVLRLIELGICSSRTDSYFPDNRQKLIKIGFSQSSANAPFSAQKPTLPRKHPTFNSFEKILCDRIWNLKVFRQFCFFFFFLLIVCYGLWEDLELLSELFQLSPHGSSLKADTSWKENRLDF